MAGSAYALTFSDEVRDVIESLVEKYHLEMSDEDFWDFSKEDPEIVIYELAERIARKEGSFKEVSVILKKELGVHQKDAEELAYEIKDKIVIPLAQPLEKQEEEAVEPKPKFEKFKLPAGVKKPGTFNVEENSKRMQEQGLTPRGEEVPPTIDEEDEEKKVKTVIPQEEKKGPDTYREPLEEETE